MTSNINLLPWREKKRALKRQQFITWLFATALLAVAISIAIPWFIGNQLKQQNKESGYIQQQSMIVTDKAQKIELIDKPAKRVHDQLVYFSSIMKSRYAIVAIFNIISQSVPSSVKLISVEKDGSTLIIKGDTNSTQDISKLLGSLNQSGLLEQAKLKEIKTTDSRSNLFTLNATIKLSKPKVKKDAKPNK
ncbi:MAG: PilN domain-containing protein [Coxiellaceae bacterium]|nr:PilN domain-containing protein [Coxiellaceae bacterium]